MLSLRSHGSLGPGKYLQDKLKRERLEKVSPEQLASLATRLAWGQGLLGPCLAQAEGARPPQKALWPNPSATSLSE